MDPAAPATSMVASFGGREGQFGLDACRAGTRPSRPFRRGARNRLVAPHVFSGTQQRDILVRLGSGGCDSAGASLLQPLTVTPVKPGAKPVPVVLGTPITLPLGVKPPPLLPGLGNLPPLPPLLSAAGGPEPETAAAPRCKGANSLPTKSRPRARKAVLCLINHERRIRGLRGLRPNHRLLRAALGHSNAMVGRDFFAHVTPGGIGVTQRLTRIHYITRRVAWRVAENLGYGTGRLGTPASIVSAWMNSAPHRANILERHLHDLGTGVVAGIPGARDRGFTYTADFGLRSR